MSSNGKGKTIDTVVTKSEVIYELSDLGLNPPTEPSWLESNPFVRIKGVKPYIAEGRAAFEALVPNRFKKK